MTDELAVIRQVVEEHRRIRGDYRQVGESISDMEAIFSLQKQHSGWALAKGDELVVRQRKLDETLNLLREGLRSHFSFEERTLPDLMGRLLMDTLRTEHFDIMLALKRAKELVTSFGPGITAGPELPAKQANTQTAISSMTRLLEDHLTREEVILGMMQTFLEEKRKKAEEAKMSHGKS